MFVHLAGENHVGPISESPAVLSSNVVHEVFLDRVACNKWVSPFVHRVIILNTDNIRQILSSYKVLLCVEKSH